MICVVLRGNAKGLDLRKIAKAELGHTRGWGGLAGFRVLLSRRAYPEDAREYWVKSDLSVVSFNEPVYFASHSGYHSGI